MRVGRLILIAAIAAAATAIRRRASPGPPVVLVPGDGGSQIEAKLNRSSSVHYICTKKTKDFFPLWLNLEELAPLVIDCFVDNMKLRWDNVTRKTVNQEGVETRIPGWGNTTTVEYLDASKSRVGIYYAALVDQMVKWGYTRGKDIRGAPYDFRKSPNEVPEFFPRLKALVEETYMANGRQKVAMIGHSMGNPFLLYFFKQQTQAWKDKYIHSFMAIAPPFGGAAKIMMVQATGYNMDHYRFLLPPSKLRPEQRSMSSTPFLMPNSNVWAKDEILVTTPTRNYSANDADYEQFYKDIGFPVGWEMYKDNKGLIHDLKPPGVEVHCMYGVGMQTPLSFSYAKGYFPDYPPTITFGDGDGTVNLRSARACVRWSGRQNFPVHTAEFHGYEHLELLQAKEVIAYVKQVLTGNATLDDVRPPTPSRIRLRA